MGIQKHRVTNDEAEKAVRDHFNVDAYDKDTQRSAESEIKQLARAVVFLSNAAIGDNDAENHD